MTGLRIFGIALIVAGVLAYAYGGFSYSKDTTAVKIGTFELSVRENKSIAFPWWACGGLVAVGALIVVFGGRRR